MKVADNQIMNQKLDDLYKKYNIVSEERQTQSQNFMKAIKDLIEVCGDDPNRQGFEETPYRVLKAHLEYTEGYKEDPKEHLRKFFDVDHNELVIVNDIEFYSLCEHHFAPFFGSVHVGYVPNGKITGLSKIGRMVDGYAKRFQVQERLTNQIATAMEEVLEPEGVMVVVEGKHMCMCGRGVKKKDSTTTTTASKGIFAKNPDARKEFFSLLGR
ncbi:GTP cyclohydrolase I FolE [Pseudogracilibacillus sp. SO30301A]|uniref:GTP cyclohydrolase I FolE n=1 Tax=Pseudogracilibacillus sp. SO30301A TaxID=3098291 RepID=UPI003FA74289